MSAQTVLTFDHTPTPSEIAARLMDEGAVAPAIAFMAICEMAWQRHTPDVRATPDEILDQIERMGLGPAFREAHGGGDR